LRIESNSADQPVKGIIALIIATLFFAVQDGMTKHLTDTVAVPQIISIRFLFFSLFAIGYAHFRCGIRIAAVSNNRGQQVVRVLMIVSEITLFSICLHFLGIAQMHAIFACFPLLITALSVPILGEKVGWRRWCAVSAGFIGTLIIIDPTSNTMNKFVLAALVCALLFAFYNILTRKLSRTDRFETSLLYFGIVGFLFSLLVVPFYWQPLASADIFWLLAVSTTSIVGHLLLIKSLQLCEAVILQPFNYFVLIWAMIVGYLVYGEVLTQQTLIGAALVVLSGVYIAYREYSVTRQSKRKLRQSLYPPDL
jgi:drug/metabolite transporter (DMT)-like permease